MPSRADLASLKTFEDANRDAMERFIILILRSPDNCLVKFMIHNEATIFCEWYHDYPQRNPYNRPFILEHLTSKYFKDVPVLGSD